ncbi:MAG TPA: FAD-dependent oxidoreductase [Spirochaetia bacterium]|nr:FAD-dependent oxidoreductase [Spirochaetia bacterium]
MAENERLMAGRLSDLADGSAMKVTVGKNDVLLVRRGSSVYACGNNCPHYGGPLNEGTFGDDTVTCPWHNASFRFTDGALTVPPALDDLPTYEVTVQNDEIFVGKVREPGIRMPDGDDRRSILVVGAGAAGNACAEALRRNGFAGSITLVTRESDRPYDRPMLSKGFVSGGAQEEWLYLRSEEFYRSLRISVKTGAAVERFDPSTRSVILSDGTTLTGDSVLLASGSRARTVAIPGAERTGVFTLRTASDARRIRAAAGTAKSAVIVGAGFIGMELAADLAQAKLAVNVVAPETEPMMAQFGQLIGARIRRTHESYGVTFHLGCTVREISGGVEAERVLLSDGSVIAADMVVLALGALPETAYLEHSPALLENGAVVVDEKLRTRADGVFAAGDIALVPYGSVGRFRIEHWVTSEAQGRHAAASMLGDQAPYELIPFFWTRQYDGSIKYLGFPGTADRIAYRGDPDNGAFLAGFYRGGHLFGAATVGMSSELLSLENAIRGSDDLPFERFAR